MNLKDLIEKVSALEKKIAQPDIKKKPQEFKRIMSSYKLLKPLSKKAKRLIELNKEFEDIQRMLKKEEDKEMRSFLMEEKHRLENEIDRLKLEIRKGLLPRDPNDIKNAIMEIRAGTGGEEASLFAADLLKMYLKFIEKRNLKASITDIHWTEIGGIREAVVIVEGSGTFGKLKYESGVHRVQRIPVTETGGRIHTSTASIVVLPEAENIEIDINLEDLKIESKRASGPGGQHVNVTDSAIRITHIPTGTVVQCQDERSQHKNKSKAMRILKAKLNQLAISEQEKKRTEIRKTQIGAQERSEKIRTYNFPQNRVTDHRISLTLYNLDQIMEGELDVLLQALAQKEEEELLKENKI